VQTEDMAAVRLSYPVTQLSKGPDNNKKDMPPLIIRFDMNKFYVLVQKEMFLALKDLKVNTYPAFIEIKGNDNYKMFMKNYGIICTRNFCV
jgi:hypothetical protein